MLSCEPPRCKVDHLGLIRPSIHSQVQESRIRENLVFFRLQFLHIPVGPDEFPFQECGIRTDSPDHEVSWKGD
jgi:hypothetical protein